MKLNDFLSRTKLISNSKFDGLKEEDVLQYLDYLGWPEPSSILHQSKGLALWILNKILSQIKKIKFGHSREYSFRNCDLNLIEYLISHVSQPNLLAHHGNVLNKIIKLQCSIDTHLDKNTLESYYKHLKTVNRLVHTLYHRDENRSEAIPGSSSDVSLADDSKGDSRHEHTHVPPTSLKLLQSLSQAEVSSILISDISLFKKWLDIYKLELSQHRSECIKILSEILNHFVVVVDILYVILENNNNIKGVCECIVDLLIVPLINMRSYIHEFDGADVLLTNSINSLTKLLFIPMDKRYINGCMEFVTSKLFDTEIIPNRIPFTFKYTTTLLSLLNESPNVLGLVLLLPIIFKRLLDNIKSVNEINFGFYAVSYSHVFIPKLLKLVRADVSNFYALSSLYNLFVIIKDFNLFTYTKERRDLITGVVTSTICTVIAILKEIYTSATHGNDAYLQHLWLLLDLLVFMRLEENIEDLLELIYKDYSMNGRRLEHTFPPFIPDSPLDDKTYLPSDCLVEEIIFSYSNSNDLSSLIDHIGEFIKKNKCDLLFLQHPRAAYSLHNSSRRMSNSQIPIVLDSFINWCNDPLTSRFMYSILTPFLSGLEFTTPTIVDKSLNKFVRLFNNIDSKDLDLALSLTCAIICRKLMAWMSIGAPSNDLFNIMDAIYKRNFENVEIRDFSSWKCLFSLCYHFKMVVNDNQYETSEWITGIESVLDKLLKYNVEDKLCNDFIVSNINAFSDIDALNNYIIDGINNGLIDYSLVLPLINESNINSLMPFMINNLNIDLFKEVVNYYPSLDDEHINGLLAKIKDEVRTCNGDCSKLGDLLEMLIYLLEYEDRIKLYKCYKDLLTNYLSGRDDLLHFKNCDIDKIGRLALLYSLLLRKLKDCEFIELISKEFKVKKVDITSSVFKICNFKSIENLLTYDYNILKDVILFSMIVDNLTSMGENLKLSLKLQQVSDIVKLLDREGEHMPIYAKSLTSLVLNSNCKVNKSILIQMDGIKNVKPNIDLLLGLIYKILSNGGDSVDYKLLFRVFYKFAHIKLSDGVIDDRCCKFVCTYNTSFLFRILNSLYERKSLEFLEFLFNEYVTQCDWYKRLVCIELLYLNKELKSEDAAIIIKLLLIHLKDLQYSKDDLEILVLNYKSNYRALTKLSNITKTQLPAYRTHSSDLLHLLIQVGLDLSFKCCDVDMEGLLEDLGMIIYNCLCNRIKLSEGLSKLQARKHTNHWIYRVHILNRVIKDYTTIIANVHNVQMYTNLSRLMGIINNKNIISITKWYLPHFLVPIIHLLYKLERNCVKNDNTVNCKKIIKSCIIESITRCDDKTKQNLFLLLPNDLRVFVKDDIK